MASAQQVPLEYRRKLLAALFTGVERHTCHEWQAHNHYLRTAVMASPGESAAVVHCCLMAPFHPLFHPPPRGASGGVRSLKPVVGRGPRDQSGGAKWCREAREVLPRPTPLRFERANGREAGRGWIAAFTTEKRPETVFRGCSEVCFLCRSQSSHWSLFQKKRGVVTLKNSPP